MKTILVNKQATKTELCSKIIKLTNQPEAIVEQKVNQLLHFGITKGFIVKSDERYKLPTRKYIFHQANRQANSKKEMAENNNYNVYVTDDVPVMADEPIMDRRIVDKHYENYILAAKDGDPFNIFNYTKEMQRSKELLQPSNYETDEYQYIVERCDEMIGLGSGYFRKKMSRVRGTLNYFRKNVDRVLALDSVDFMICLTKLLRHKNFFEVARLHKNDNLIRLSDDRIRLWNRMSAAINRYLNTKHPNDHLTWTRLSEAQIIIVIRYSLMSVQETMNDGIDGGDTCCKL